ncbi:hypothetical protein QYF36_019372 [Acer negundo]|nr:hypothetical protein QYF36_019372 [Acer negundo]
MEMGSCLQNTVSFAAMVTVECTDVGLSVISKVAMTQGMNNFVSVVYYNALATLILLPYFIFRRNKRASLTFSLLLRFFLLAFIGSSGQILYFTAIKFSSPTLSSAMANLIPIFTFLLAVIFRMEKLDLRRSSSQAKALGAIVAVTGAFIITLYKGPPLWMISSTSDSPHQLLLSQESDWVIGGLLLVLVFIESASWNVVQAATVMEYPEEMTIIFFFTFFITIQAGIFSVIVERNLNAWKLKTNVEIIAIVCQAIFGSLFRISIHTWCLRKNGPVYVAMFKPLGMVVAVILTVIFLGYTLYLGSVVGGIVIALGFYTLMWGQMKEKKMVLESEEDCSSLESACQRTPLFQTNEEI